MRPRLAITVGDPAGIGPEIIASALRSKMFDAEIRILGELNSSAAGRPSPETARSALLAMEQAAQLANAREVDAIVTGPIHKARMAEIGFDFPGQTEFFAARSNTNNYAMLLTTGSITVALVTSHIPLRDVPAALTIDEIVRVGKLLLAFLWQRERDLPKVALAGLNPHAGEDGKIGREEIEIIAPAVQRLIAETHDCPCEVEGPIPPDTLFLHLINKKWDAAVCMYHDQGLIPLKLHGFDQGVNVTLGLPYARTSPDHGTAFDIAGKNVARAHSMIAAIELAVELARKK